MKQRIISVSVCLAMLFTMLPAPTFAVTTISSASNVSGFAGGSGTAADPYLIETKEHLNNVRNDLDAHYKMITDIVFTDADFATGGKYYTSGRGWSPIGFTENEPFTGTFDGDGHFIAGLTLTRYDATRYAGLFGWCDGTIKNLGITDSAIAINANSSYEYIYAGSIAGYAGSGSLIINCWSDSDVSAYAIESGSYSRAYAGGIVGMAEGTALINSCYSIGNTGAYAPGYASSAFAGGIVGGIGDGGTVDDSCISNCFNAGNVIGDGNVGGIAGRMWQGTVEGCYNVGVVDGESFGGIAGYAVSKATINNNYYLNSISKAVGNVTNDGANVACTTLQLANQATYTNFDFTNTWEFINKNHYIYPTLVENPYFNSGFDSGSGTEADPYVIRTKEHLNNVRNYLDAHYKMVADIVFTDEDFAEGGAFYNGGSGFIPIGSKDEAFCGSFDGNGHSISNFLIYSSATSGDAYAGLFAINNGVIKNLGIENGNISVYPDSNQYAYCGSIAGKNLGTITDCYNTGSVWSRRYAGGIAGYNSGTITDCYNNGAITASKDFDLSAGGIVGYNYDGIISNCYNNGQISSSANVVSSFRTTYYAFAGGIVGYGYDGTIEKCHNTGDINAVSKVTITENSDAYASANAGGIIGSNRSCSIVQCYNIGAISADTTADGYWYDTAKSYAGGIAGSNASGIGSCYNVGTLTTTSSTGHNYPGGIAGNNSGNISTSYNVGSGIENISSNNSGTIKNCYFHSETLSAGCKLASLFSVLTYQGFNFESVWQMADGDYPLPVLRSVKNYASFEYSPEENTVDFASGKGTEADPFIIKTITHLDNIRKYPSSYFALANDITFEPENEAFVAGWKPFAFKGYLDGKGYKITGIRITVSNTLEYQWRDPGLFSSNDGTIKNITVEDMRISVSNMGDKYGGFICAANNGEIINCHSEGCTISLQNIYHFFGGIAGNNSGSINNCTSNNTFNWSSNGGRIGGIAANNTGAITGCTNNSTITNIGSYTPISGGIAAQNSGDIIGSNNLASILTRSTYSQRNSYSGGIVGQMTGGQISQCYNLGAISTEATEYKANTYSAGIVAYISNGNILDCYNTGDIYGEPNSSSASCYVGGIVGYNNSIGTIKNCYSVGANSGRASSSNLYVGYICGYNASNTIENCYYLGVADNGSGSGDFSTMYGKTIAALKEKATYANFDFNNTWTLSGNGDYPFPELLSTPMAYEKEIKLISIESMPTKLQYIQNYESLNLAGGMLKITYGYDESEIIPLSNATVSGFDNTAVGKQNIEVSYLGHTTEFEIEIVKKSLVRIEITALPNKTTYYEGDTLVLDGLIVIAHYNDETFEPITGYSISEFSSTPGTKTITVQYQEKTVTFDVVVKKVELVSIAVTSKPTKLTYLEGESFSKAGMIITAYYNNGTNTVVADYTVSGYSSTPGVKTIEISYGSKTVTFEVTVIAKSLTGISITSKPSKLVYLEGDALDTTGLIVKAHYDNGTSGTITDYTVSGYSSTPGVKTIEVSYSGKTAQFDVTVNARSLTGITVSKNPGKIAYLEGELLDLSGLVINATYNNGTNANVTDYSVSGFDTCKVGQQTITVTYGGKTATFVVTVKSRVPDSITSDVYTVSDDWIRKISAGTKVSNLINGINEKQYIKVFNGNQEVSGDAIVGTGMVVKLMDGNTVKATVTMVVTGDTNGDGKITITDMLAVKSHVLKKTTLSGAAAQAADTSKDGGISITDFIQIKASILGKGTIAAN